MLAFVSYKLLATSIRQGLDLSSHANSIFWAENARSFLDLQTLVAGFLQQTADCVEFLAREAN